MGWFDKKSWQLRRKIRDLQTELAEAEREGKYVIGQGLFFAELREMGDQTMMVLGAANQFDSTEDDVIRSFFERNGFSVEILKLDKTHKNLADVEIIPPEELTKHVARSLQEMGYKLVDDSEQERPADLSKKLVTLSSLLRTITVLFVSHVNHIIISTPLKLNMEGNRLLHWLPRIQQAQTAKIPAQLVAECVDPFVEGYNHYYGRFGHIDQPEVLRKMAEELPRPATDQPVRGEDNSSTEFSSSSPSTSPSAGTPAWAGQRGSSSAAVASSAPVMTPPVGTQSQTRNRNFEAAQLLAHMYRSLIGATTERKVRNAEAILENIGRFYSAKSTCLLVRNSPDTPLRLHANSGSTFCISTNVDGSVTCESESIRNAVASGQVSFSQPQGNGNTKVEAVALPLDIGTNTAIIYILEPTDFSPSDDGHDLKNLLEFSKIFREYPDLLI